MEKKPPSVSQISSPPLRNSSHKIRDVTRKNRNPKNEAEIQLLFSELVAPLQKMGEVFFLQPVMKKKLFRFLKFNPHFPIILFARRGVKQTKKRVVLKNWGKMVFWGKVVF
jgi:hypothetical protein